jgi:hypothetical protein
MIKLILNTLITIFSITPLSGDKVEILEPKRPSGHNRFIGLYAEIQTQRRLHGIDWKISFPRFPDISKFEIVLGYFNPLLLAFGLAGRLPGTLNTSFHKNRGANRYLLYMKARLLGAYNNPKLFWAIAGHLIQRSNSYAIGCVHEVEKNLYRKYTYSQYKHLIRTLDEIRGRMTGQMSPHLLYHRTYIPKGTSSFRPLGVPTMSWRVYLNMLLHPLVMFTKLDNGQHGFRPGLGTLTAWKDILLGVIGSPNIYEFDLKQCFPSISLPRLEKRLNLVYRLPKSWANYYTGLNYVPPQFKNVDVSKLNESQMWAVINTRGGYKQDASPSFVMENGLPRFPFQTIAIPPDDPAANSWLQAPVQSVVQEILTIPDLETRSTLPADVLHSFMQSMEGLHSYYYDTTIHNIRRSISGPKGEYPIKDPKRALHEWVKLVGTAQGSPLSPFLAALALDEVHKWLPKGVKILLYADDGMFYGPGVKAFVQSGDMYRLMSRLGFTIHPAKSSWIKQDDAWEKPLKFLGITYHGTIDLLMASTRNGADLVYNKQALVDAEFDVDHAMELGAAGLAEKVFDMRKLAASYRAMREHAKAQISDNLIDYYGRLLLLLTSMSNIVPPKVGITYDASKDAFIWYYYILVTRLFYMSKDYIIRAVAGGALALRDKHAIHKYLLDNFTPTGLEQTPSAQHILPLRDETKSQSLRKFQSFLRLFSYTEESASRGIVLHNPMEAFPLYEHRHKFIIESNNEYLKRYRSRYTWSNFVHSRFCGFIMSRLYNNTFLFDNFTQDFKYRATGCSIGATLLRRKDPNLSVFTGTSFAVPLELGLCQKVQSSTGFNRKFPYLTVAESKIEANDIHWSDKSKMSQALWTYVSEQELVEGILPYDEIMKRAHERMVSHWKDIMAEDKVSFNKAMKYFNLFKKSENPFAPIPRVMRESNPWLS